MSELSANDLNLITTHISKVFDSKIIDLKQYVDGRISDMEKRVDLQIRELHQVHETNHNSLYYLIKKVEEDGVSTNQQAKLTNGNVLRINNTVFGEKDCNGDIIKGKEGLVTEMSEVKRYRPFYRKPLTMAIIFLLMIAIFVEESRDMILKYLGFK